MHCALRAGVSQVFTLVAELTSGSEQVVATSVYVVKSTAISKCYDSIRSRNGDGGYVKYGRRAVRGRT